MFSAALRLSLLLLLLRTQDRPTTTFALQSGQVFLWRSHLATQGLWNMWSHPGRTLQGSPASNGVTQMAHDSLPPLPSSSLSPPPTPAAGGGPDGSSL
jgi:hypothetical protein